MEPGCNLYAGQRSGPDDHGPAMEPGDGAGVQPPVRSGSSRTYYTPQWSPAMEPGCNLWNVLDNCRFEDAPQWSPAMEPGCNRSLIITVPRLSRPQWSPAMEPGCNPPRSPRQ